MSNNKYLFDDITVDGENLSENARLVAADAMSAMRSWLAEGVTQIESEFIRRANEATGAFEIETAKMIQTLDELSGQFDLYEQTLKVQASKLEETPLNKEALETLLNATATMKADLEKKKAIAANIGKNAVRLAVAAVKKTALPLV